MAKNLKNLLRPLNNYKVFGPRDVTISGISDDSRQIVKDGLFVAIKGATIDAHNFIPQALKKGAAAVVGEKLPDESSLGDKTYIQVKDSREVLGTLASEFYGNPSKKLKIIGVTGTKGKTTTVHLIYHIINGLGKKVGLISSITARGFHVTTPDVISLHKLLAEMVDTGCQYAVIEVSSHGIDQKRIAGVKFDVGVLTNIAPEHLDYHKHFADYKRVKMSFINSAGIKIIAPSSTELDILPGKFNNLNAEAAVLAVTSLGFDKDKVLATLPSFKLPEGRLEEIDAGNFKVVIDFAHTPDSLEAVLSYLKSKTSGRLIAVFGCAGERDTKKRFQMGKIAAKLADFSVFTAEDPRSENIFKILAKMAEGAKSTGVFEGKDFLRIPLRGEAVAFALSFAKKGDIVGIFGKGHEKSMAYKGFEHPWSDRREVENFLNRDREISAIILAAGKGTRMKSARPKILHEICGRPMISYSLENLRHAVIGEIVAVVSYRKNVVEREIAGAVKIAVQKNPKGGTADATSAGLPMVSDSVKYVMVLYGDDTAFYSPETIKKVLADHSENGATLTFVTLVKENPFGLGRIIRDEKGSLLAIVEEKDATSVQRQVKEINDGLYFFDKNWLEENIKKVKRSVVTGEYYLVDLIKMAISQGKKVTAYRLPGDSEWQGVNTPEELALAEKRMDEKLTSYND